MSSAPDRTPLNLFGHAEPVVELESSPPADETFATSDLSELIVAGKTFGTILADPPWLYETWSKKGQGRSPKYPTMTADEIAALPVQKLAAKNCRLFMWSTWPHLPQAISVMRAWGFPFSTAPYVWVKANKWALNGPVNITDPSIWWLSKGTWTRPSSEVVLSGKRGMLERLTKGMPSIVVAPRGRHSEKPEEIARRIERLVGGPYLELFARRARRGWTCWGNEIPDISGCGGCDG